MPIEKLNFANVFFIFFKNFIITFVEELNEKIIDG